MVALRGTTFSRPRAQPRPCHTYRRVRPARSKTARALVAVATAWAASWAVAGADGPVVSALAAPPCAPGPLTFTKLPTYSKELSRKGDFKVSVELENGAACPQTVTLLMGFTPPATTATRERSVKITFAPGASTRDVVLTNAELLKANITPGVYAVTFAIYDSKGAKVGDGFYGNPLTFGSSVVALPTAPPIPPGIGRSDALTVPFTFTNDGDTVAKVTALLVFTKPGETKGVEVYFPDLMVKPGTSTHTAVVDSARRTALGIAPGPWLVTATAFDGAFNRVETYAGTALTIGAIGVTLADAPSILHAIGREQDFEAEFTFENAGDTADRVVALLVFQREGVPHPIEHVVRDVVAERGSSKHIVRLTAAARMALGMGPGTWRVTASGFDGLGNRLSTYPLGDLAIRDRDVTYPTPRRPN